jgi:hypothetical protein
MTSTELLTLIKSLNLPLGTYAAIGSAAMAVRNIREAHDLDIVVLPEVFAKMGSDWKHDDEFFTKWNRRRLIKGDIEMYQDLYIDSIQKSILAETVINKADIIEGVAFMSLDDLMMYKRNLNREKDVRDIALIETYQRAQGIV